MLGIIYISIFILILFGGIIYSLYNRERFEAELGFSIMVLIYFLAKTSFFILFNISIENYLKIGTAQILWKLCIFIRIFSIGLFSSIHIMELHKKSKVKYLAIIIYFFLEGIIIGLLLSPESFLTLTDENYYYYLFQEPLLLTFLLSFNFLVIAFTFISQIMGYQNFNDKKLGNFYSAYIILMSFNIIIYSIFLIVQNIILANLFAVSYLVISCFTLYVIIKKPALFLVFTNKIYDLIIFHRSGILLYSYNFQSNREVDEFLLKGSILIGINHILSNFSGVENQLDHIKMSDKGVIFNFQNELGYAVLLIAKHKNKILERAVYDFIAKFSDQNKKNLLNLTGLIDVSTFKETGKLVRKCFSKYIVV